MHVLKMNPVSESDVPLKANHNIQVEGTSNTTEMIN